MALYFIVKKSGTFAGGKEEFFLVTAENVEAALKELKIPSLKDDKCAHLVEVKNDGLAKALKGKCLLSKVKYKTHILY